MMMKRPPGQQCVTRQPRLSSFIAAAAAAAAAPAAAPAAQRQTHAGFPNHLSRLSVITGSIRILTSHHFQDLANYSTFDI